MTPVAPSEKALAAARDLVSARQQHFSSSNVVQCIGRESS